MPREFNFRESLNMVYAVSGTYITKKEVESYFNENFDKDKMFQPDELINIVKTVTAGRKRITTKMEDHNIWGQKRNYGRRPGEPGGPIVPEAPKEPDER